MDRYLRLEWEDKKEKSMPYKEYEICSVRPKVPVQTNGSDCGVFALEYSRHFLDHISDMPATAEMIQGNLCGIFNPGMFESSSIDRIRVDGSRLAGVGERSLDDGSDSEDWRVSDDGADIGGARDLPHYDPRRGGSTEGMEFREWERQVAAAGD